MAIEMNSKALADKICKELRDRCERRYLMNINPIRYTLTVNPKEGKPYNPIHDAIQGTICSILDIEVGERGWFMVWSDYDGWHRIHTSTVESVATDEVGGESMEIVVTTHNTVYTFKKIEENT